MAQHELFPQLTEAVLTGDDEVVPGLCEQAVAAGLAPMTIITDGMAPGAQAAGEKFANGEYFMPQLVMAGEAMSAGLNVLLPLITSDARAESDGVVVIGSVEGDVHDIGKNIVSAMLTAGGFHVVDLGIDVPAAEFVEKVTQDGAQIVAMGSYMSTTLPQIEGVIKALQEADLRDNVRVMVGGAAVTQKYADVVGADGFAEDAPGAVNLAKQLVGGV